MLILPSCHSLMKNDGLNLYQDLSKASLVIFKGDLNYRKLVGDLKWEPTDSFTEALQGFHPAPLVSLRTLVTVWNISLLLSLFLNKWPFSESRRCCRFSRRCSWTNVQKRFKVDGKRRMGRYTSLHQSSLTLLNKLFYTKKLTYNNCTNRK